MKIELLTFSAIMYDGTISTLCSSISFLHSILTKSPARGDFTMASTQNMQNAPYACRCKWDIAQANTVSSSFSDQSLKARIKKNEYRVNGTHVKVIERKDHQAKQEALNLFFTGSAMNSTVHPSKSSTHASCSRKLKHCQLFSCIRQPLHRMDNDP
jgi:hypothetical protein